MKVKIKIFTSDENGKISFTKAELENLLNEVYSEGQRDGYCSMSTITPYYNSTDGISNSISTIRENVTLTEG
jgi:hypothetical protein